MQINKTGQVTHHPRFRRPIQRRIIPCKILKIDADGLAYGCVLWYPPLQLHQSDVFSIVQFSRNKLIHRTMLKSHSHGILQYRFGFLKIDRRGVIPISTCSLQNKIISVRKVFGSFSDRKNVTYIVFSCMNGKGKMIMQEICKINIPFFIFLFVIIADTFGNNIDHGIFLLLIAHIFRFQSF